jgi:hypothetical protein
MDRPDLSPQDKIRMILKFDTGADGFMKMIYVLAATSIVVLIVGIVFLQGLLKDLGTLQ